MVWGLISMGRECKIYYSITQEQRSTLILPKRYKRCPATRSPVAIPWHAGLNDNRTAKPLASGSDIERMKPVHIIRRTADYFLSLSDNVERTGSRIDDRAAGDANLGGDITALSRVAGGTVVIPAAGLIKLTFHNGLLFSPSASNAYTLSCSVATYVTLWKP